jgi:hypothetical protein
MGAIKFVLVILRECAESISKRCSPIGRAFVILREVAESPLVILRERAESLKRFLPFSLSLAPCGRGQGEGSLFLKCFLPFGFGRGSGRVIASRFVGVAIHGLFVILRECAESIGKSFSTLPLVVAVAVITRGALSPRGNPETDMPWSLSLIAKHSLAPCGRGRFAQQTR